RSPSRSSTTREAASGDAYGTISVSNAYCPGWGGGGRDSGGKVRARAQGCACWSKREHKHGHKSAGEGGKSYGDVAGSAVQSWQLSGGSRDGGSVVDRGGLRRGDPARGAGRGARVPQRQRALERDAQAHRLAEVRQPRA